MSEEYKRRARMQDEDPPVIINRKKRPMDEGELRTQPTRGELEYMPQGEPSAQATEGLDLMAPIPRGAAEAPAQPPPQAMPRKAQPAEGEEERYVRMRVRVRGDQMEVVGAWAVNGPLIQPERLHAGLAFEVALGERQVDMGSIPDVGVRRSFPPPEPAGEMKGHHIEEMPSYEFPIRVPQRELSERGLPDLRVSVYRIKGEVPSQRAMRAPLLDQFAEELRPVAELKGIHLPDLPQGVQEEIKRALER